MNRFIGLTVLTLAFGCGCSSIARNFDYRVVVVNLSSILITDNKVFDSSNEYNYGCGDLVSFGYAANAGPMETAPNDIFTVRWTDDKKATHEQKFDLREKVKRSFKGELVFIYGADGKFSVEIGAVQRQYPIPQRPKP